MRASRPRRPTPWPKGALNSLVAAVLLPIMVLWWWIQLTLFLPTATFYKLLDTFAAKQRLSQPRRGVPTQVMKLRWQDLAWLWLFWLCLPLVAVTTFMLLLFNVPVQTVRWLASWSIVLDRRLTQHKWPTWLLSCALGIALGVTGTLQPSISGALAAHLPAGHHLTPSSLQGTLWGVAAILVIAGILQGCRWRRFRLPKRLEGLHANVVSAVTMTAATACLAPSVLNLVRNVSYVQPLLAGLVVTLCCGLSVATAYHVLLVTGRRPSPSTGTEGAPRVVHRLVSIPTWASIAPTPYGHHHRHHNQRAYRALQATRTSVDKLASDLKVSLAP